MSNVCETHQGIITGKKAVGDTARRKNIILAQDMLSLPPERVDLCKKVIDGKNVPYRYAIDWHNEYLIYAPDELTAPREVRWFEAEKLVIQKIAKHVTATYDTDKFYCLDTLYIGLQKDASYNLKYILAILNSRLLDFYYKAAFGAVHIGSDYLEYRTRYLNTLPIKPASREKQAELVGLVDEILTINKELPRLKALADDFSALVSSLQLPLVPLASSPAVKQVSIPPVLGIPKLSLGGESVYLARKAFIEMVDEKHARYLFLYLDAIKDELRGSTQGELLQLACLPTSASAVNSALARKTALEEEVKELEARRSNINEEIDNKVYELYNLTDKKIALVKTKARL